MSLRQGVAREANVARRAVRSRSTSAIAHRLPKDYRARGGHRRRQTKRKPKAADAQRPAAKAGAMNHPRCARAPLRRP